ncbi:MAG: hypothetical protein WAJ93_04510 [Candidatus Nitrosopolaris sp.]
MSTVLVLLIAAAAATILTSNLALADWETSFQQKPQIAFPGSSAAIMPYVNKIGSGSSSSSSFVASSSTAKDPYEHISSNNINPLQPRDGSPLASRTNNNNVDANAYSITTTGNTGFTPTTRTIQPMTVTSEPSHAQRQQQNPTSPEVVTPRSPSQVTPPIVTLSFGGQITCKPTELLRSGKCIPQPPTCVPIGLSQDSKCSPRPSYHHHILMLKQSVRSFWHR